MELRLLRTLVAIADHHTFVAAGEALGLSQSAVSLHVKALEDELGIRLFNRAKRPPVLNATGRDMVVKAREIVALCEHITDVKDDSTFSGSLSLGAVPTALTGILPEALGLLRANQPQLRIQVSSGLSAELAARVQDGELDTALVSKPAQLANELQWHAVAAEPLMVLARADLPGKTDKALLEAAPYIRFQKLAWAGQQIDTQLRDRNIRIVPGMEVDSLEAVSLLVAQGLGVSVAPQRKLNPPFPANVRTLPFGKPPLYREIGLIQRAANPRRHLVQALHDELIRISERNNT